MMPLYCVKLENGQEYRVYAEDAKEAWSKAVEIWPELFNQEVRDITLVE
jgi:hypothetical protein